MPSRALLAALLLAAPLAAQESIFQQQPDPKSNTRVEVVALFSRPAPGGFLPVRVSVTNAGEQEGSIDLRCTANDGNYGGEGSEMTSTFKLDAPAGKSVQHDILVPCTTLLNIGYGRGGTGTVNLTVAMSGAFGANTGSLTGSYLDDQPALLLSETLHTPNASTLDAQLNSKGHRGYGGSIAFAGKFDPRGMPEDWRAYSGYDGIGMTDGDWGLLSPGARNAILRWNRLGGQLVIHAQSANSDLATLGISHSGGGQRSALRSFGNIEILPTGTDLRLDTNGADAMIDRFNSKDNLPILNQSIRSDFSGSWPLQIEFGGERYNYMLFILILIGFGVLVGPVNLFVFAKSGQRHRLFITTPIIALGTSVLLVGLIIAIDGFGGRGMRVALMEIRPDDGENSAYIYQEQVSRTGVLLGGDFTIGEPAAISPVPLSSSSQWSRLTDRNNGGGMRYEANLRDGKLEVDGDWFQSRSEQGQLVRAIVPTRGRIELRNTSGPPSLVSTFDFPVEKIYYRDHAGLYWYAEGIERGKAFDCREAQPAEVIHFVNEAKGKLSTRSREALEALSPVERGNRHFIAVTSGAPGIETFGGIDWKETRTYITGPVATP
jgi:hypothetical protein